MPNDLTTSSTAADIALQPRFHKVIADGMRYRIFAKRRLMNEESQAKVLYENSKRDMISQMRARNQGVVQIISGNLSNYA